MREFVGEHYLSSEAAQGPGRCAKAARAAADQLRREGTRVYHVRSILIPEDETCIHLYRAESIEACASPRHARHWTSTVSQRRSATPERQHEATTSRWPRPGRPCGRAAPGANGPLRRAASPPWRSAVAAHAALGAGTSRCQGERKELRMFARRANGHIAAVAVAAVASLASPALAGTFSSTATGAGVAAATAVHRPVAPTDRPGDEHAVREG